MDGVEFYRPHRAVDVRLDPRDADFTERKPDVAVAVWHALATASRVDVADAATIGQLTADMLGDDDTTRPPGPIYIRNYPEFIEVEMSGDVRRVLDDASVRASEPVIMPLHATSIFICVQHDRSDDWYCSGIITCEQGNLDQGISERPFFVWM